MGKVISLHQPPREGDSTFLMCPCTDDGAPFIPVAIVADTPIITALVCPECEQEVPVVNGYVGVDQ